MTAVLCKVDIHLPETHSLKEKRSLLRKIIARTQQKFDVVISEVGCHDLLQRTELGFGYVGTDAVLLNRLVDETVSYMDEIGLGETIGSEREIVHL